MSTIVSQKSLGYFKTIQKNHEIILTVGYFSNSE